METDGKDSLQSSTCLFGENAKLGGLLRASLWLCRQCEIDGRNTSIAKQT